MYIGSWNIDDYLTFSCNTHNPDTSVSADADGEPTYRIYEDETAAPILTGTLSLLDDANTTGFYSERIQLTAANGFEAGKCYTVRISATVSGLAGATERFFQIKASVNVVDWKGAAAPDVATEADVAAEVLTEMNATPPAVNVKKVNDTTLTGDGSAITPWGPA